MIPIKSLEFRMASVIRAGLRQSLRNANPRDIPTSIRHAQDRLTDSLYAPLYAQIVAVYSEGYTSAGELIRRHAPRGTLLTASAPVPREDPRIAKATKAVIYGVQGSLGNHKNEIQATMRDGFEKGQTIPEMSKRLDRYFDNNRVASTRFARTAATDIYNRARLDRYEDSGVVDGTQFSAHVDERITDICRMYDGTIWAIGDPDIKVPSLHYSCRSDLLPYFGGIPPARDFSAEFGEELVDSSMKTADTFQKSWGSPMPQSKASATYQRSYFPKGDTKIIDKGLSLAIKEERAHKAVPDIIPLERLKGMLRYRKLEPDKSMIVDRFGKSLMLDKFEERDIIRAVKALITQTDGKLVRETLKRKKIIDSAWKDVLATRKGIAKMEKDILHYQKRMKADPTNAASYLKFIAQDKRLIETAKAQESRQVMEWNRLSDMKPSAATQTLEAEKKRYEHMLDNFKFQKR